MIKPLSTKLFLSVLILFCFGNFVYSQLYEWRGPDRSGIYNETGLLKKWPDGGPALLWEARVWVMVTLLQLLPMMQFM